MTLKHVIGGPNSAARAAWEIRRRQLEAGSFRHTVLGPRPRRQILRKAGPLIVSALRAVGLYGPGRRNALSLAVNSLELAFPNLPSAFDDYRVLLISDPHLESLPELAQVAAQALRGLVADLIVLTGDFQRRPPTDPAHAAALLAPVLHSVTANDAIVATLGNHDSYAVVPHLESLGITVLVNEAVEIERGGAVLSVCGTDDVATFYTREAETSLHAQRGDFRIALVHTPELAQTAAAAGASLYLCGHTHGGQVCLPGGRPIFTFVEVNKGYARGLWRCGEMVGYTTTGLGTGAVPVRFACPPEVMMIRLRRG
jgi:predicted MPP superfamily phosphohydrolase